MNFSTFAISLIALVASTQALSLYQAGGYVADFNMGTCMAFMTEPSDTSTDCYKACSNTGTAIQNMFDRTQYTYGTFTTSQLMTFGTTTAIMLMTQMSQCR